MSTLITGGTGLIGRSLVARLGGADIVTRDPDRAQRQTWPRGTRFVGWRDQTKPLELPGDVRPEAVVNLMGESIAAQRWTAAFKQRLRDSRINGTRQLIAGLSNADALPKVFVSASAIGYYGDRGEEWLQENSTPGTDFLAELCQDWEAETAALRDSGVRVVNLRIGIVLERNGGALQQMLPIFRRGAGGRLGSGKQWFPWIHVTDVIELVVWLLANPQIAGPVNAVSPGIVTNAEFTKVLASVLNRPAVLPVPKFALRAAVGEFADSLLASARVTPAVATEHGYAFRYPELRAALSELLVK